MIRTINTPLPHTGLLLREIIFGLTNQFLTSKKQT
ncbi:MAG: hypothetical protein ACJAUD_000067 [Crocinitomicaceae bacterium]|jgi:hypothetical protein